MRPTHWKTLTLALLLSLPAFLPARADWPRDLTDAIRDEIQAQQQPYALPIDTSSAKWAIPMPKQTVTCAEQAVGVLQTDGNRRVCHVLVCTWTIGPAPISSTLLFCEPARNAEVKP